jgi:hypothetical protein
VFSARGGAVGGPLRSRAKPKQIAQARCGASAPIARQISPRARKENEGGSPSPIHVGSRDPRRCSGRFPFEHRRASVSHRTEKSPGWRIVSVPGPPRRDGDGPGLRKHRKRGIPSPGIASSHGRSTLRYPYCTAMARRSRNLERQSETRTVRQDCGGTQWDVCRD